jgi:Flp pilus assembly protein TadG
MSHKGKKGMFQKLRKLTKSERGATAVEFALLLPIIATLTFGMIDFGRMLWFQEVLVNATRTGARQGTLFNSGNGTNEIQGFVAQALTNGGVPPAGLNVTVNGLGTGQGNPLTVTSTIPWQYMVIDSLIPALNTPQLQASVVMMNE